MTVLFPFLMFKPPPFTPEEPVSCHASNAEIRSQRRSGLVFLGKSCKQTLTEQSLPNNFNPTVVPRLPPSTSVPHRQRTRKRGLIYLFMYLFLSISFASKPVFTPSEPEYFADNRRMRSRSLNDWEKFATRRRDAWLACFSSHFGAVIWARLRSASAYFNDI